MQAIDGQPLDVEFGRAVCGSARASALEWLVTNGIGGFASGTVSGELARRYHGLLVSALEPPLGRKLLAVKWNETARYLGKSMRISGEHLARRSLDEAARALERFHLEGTTPVWTYALADARLEKRIWMQPGANTTYLRYTLVSGSAPLELAGELLANDRDYHGATLEPFEPASDPVSTPITDGLRVLARAGGTPLYIRANAGAFRPAQRWVGTFTLDIERERGFAGREIHLLAGRHRVTLQPGEDLTLVFSTQADAAPDGEAAYAQRQSYEADLLARLPGGNAGADPVLARLALAADQFIVARPSAEDPNGRSVIAGYPWFSDWGRDTMISLPGLALATGLPEAARSILTTFARHVSMGMLPNRFPDAGDVPEYNTVDATLWYFEAVRAYLASVDDPALLEELYPVLEDIIAWHQRGTRYSIHVDPVDGLLYAGEPGVQLTWMDVKIGDWVVTPRTGKAVEINALWYHALRCMVGFATRLERDPRAYDAAAQLVRENFRRFWNPDHNCCFDVIDGPNGDDASIRPNQVIAAALLYSPLDDETARAVVETCARTLLTSHGLRSLAPSDPAYKGRFGGDYVARDSAYHQGTVWSWLIGPFIAAHLRVYLDKSAARRLLLPLVDHLRDAGLGSISEVFDGDPPHHPGGCHAQAWGVAELLRAWQMTGV